VAPAKSGVGPTADNARRTSTGCGLICTGAVLTLSFFPMMFDLHRFWCQDGLASTSVGEASAWI
jgi:hypothetical protein